MTVGRTEEARKMLEELDGAQQLAVHVDGDESQELVTDAKGKPKWVSFNDKMRTMFGGREGDGNPDTATLKKSDFIAPPTVGPAPMTVLDPFDLPKDVVATKTLRDKLPPQMFDELRQKLTPLTKAELSARGIHKVTVQWIGAIYKNEEVTRSLALSNFVVNAE